MNRTKNLGFLRDIPSQHIYGPLEFPHQNRLKQMTFWFPMSPSSTGTISSRFPNHKLKIRNEEHRVCKKIYEENISRRGYEQDKKSWVLAWHPITAHLWPTEICRYSENVTSWHANNFGERHLFFLFAVSKVSDSVAEVDFYGGN
jgi:hypothetical protein